MHVVTTRPADANLPIFFNVDTSVGKGGSLIANELSTPIRLAITTGAMVLFVIGRIALQR